MVGTGKKKANTEETDKVKFNLVERASKPVLKKAESERDAKKSKVSGVEGKWRIF